MTAKKFAEVALQMLGKNSQDFKIDERVPLAIAELVLPEIFEQYIIAGTAIPAGFFISNVFPIQLDTVRDLQYIEPDPSILDITENIAIRRLGAKKEEEHTCIIVEPGTVSQISELEIADFGGRFYGWPEGSKVYLRNVPLLMQELVLTYVPQFSEMDDDDEIFGGTVSRMMLDAVVERLQRKVQTPEDKINDGISNPN